MPSDPTAFWSPNPQWVIAEGKLRWAQVELSSGCSGAANTPPVTPVEIVQNAAQFEARFCRKTDLDWSRHRLLWAHVPERVGDVTVVRDGAQINMLVSTRSTCDAAWGSEVAVIIDDLSLPVVLLVRPGPALPCPDGIAY